MPKHSLLAEAEGARIGQVEVELRHVMDAYERVADFDIVHDHTVSGPVYAQGFPDLPVITTMHGSLEAEFGDIYRRIAPSVPLVAVSAAQLEAAPTLPAATVIHHGVDASRFPFIDGPREYALFVGRMAREKGAGPAIDAARRAMMPLVLAGKMRSPEELAYFTNEVEPQLNVDPNVFYLGEVSHDRKLGLFSNARCLLFPIAWREPFGIVLLEALACGTPVVGLRAGRRPRDRRARAYRLHLQGRAGDGRGNPPVDRDRPCRAPCGRRGTLLGPPNGRRLPEHLRARHGASRSP